MKNAYTRAIFTDNERKKMAEALDPVLQLVMPYGPATPNRAGVLVDMDASVANDFLKVSGIFSSLSEKEAEEGFNKTKYMQFGGGVKVDFSRIISALTLTEELSMSYTYSSAVNDGIVDQTTDPTLPFFDFRNQYRYAEFRRLPAVFQKGCINWGISAECTQFYFNGFNRFGKSETLGCRN